MLVEANSHYASWGVNGFSFHTKSFVDSQANDRWTVTIGVSDLKTPTPRVVDWKKEMVFVPSEIIKPFSPSIGGSLV
jgi:hypothetical protein